ncbi:hypothetical protein DFN09_004039 [Clostridium acetobutylicum]|nr:hypothetical protein [Clostridium acetobutylicum]
MDKVFKEFNKVTLKLYNLWSNHMIYTWRWWLQVLIAILPWILWVIIRKKESAGRLLYAGFFYYAYSNIYGCTWNYAGFMGIPSKASSNISTNGTMGFYSDASYYNDFSSV